MRVLRVVRPSLYPFYSQNCLHIFSKVFRSTAKHPTQEVGSIRDVDPKEFKRIIRTSSIYKFQHITYIKSFDFSTFYTTIPDQKLKIRLATIIRNSRSFNHKNGNRRYKFLVLGREGPYFVKETLGFENKYTEDDIINMLEFLVDNIFVVFGGKGFPTDSRHSNGHELCPSPSRHISVLIRSGIHTVFSLSTGKKKISISVQLYIQIHRGRIVNQ